MNSSSSMEFFEVVEKRRSIRRYKDVEVKDDDLTHILEAARLAPSAENSQPWRFIVVKERSKIEILSEVASNQKFIANAGAIIVVLGHQGASCCGPNHPASWHIKDPMIAAEHLVLAATALGYGSCWIAMHNTRPEPVLKIAKGMLQIPDEVDIIVLITIGVPDELPKARPRKSLETIAFSENYGIPWPA